MGIGAAQNSRQKDYSGLRVIECPWAEGPIQPDRYPVICSAFVDMIPIFLFGRRKKNRVAWSSRKGPKRPRRCFGGQPPSSSRAPAPWFEPDLEQLASRKVQLLGDSTRHLEGAGGAANAFTPSRSGGLHMQAIPTS